MCVRGGGGGGGGGGVEYTEDAEYPEGIECVERTQVTQSTSSAPRSSDVSESRTRDSFYGKCENWLPVFLISGGPSCK